jgi:predicted transcriptional regulator
MLPNYDIDTQASKRLVMMRILNADRSGYIFPELVLHDYGINLEVIQSVLQDLVERGHAEIMMTPNYNLTDAERARKDDEQDYYFIDLTESFDGYYREVERTASFHNADKDTAKPLATPVQPIAITNAVPHHIKVEPRSYDTANGVLILGGITVQIIKQPNKKGKLHESKEARLMRLLFKDVNTLKNGVPMRTIASVRTHDFNSKHRKLVKSYIAEINRKLPKELGINQLVTNNQNAVMIDERYL